MGQKRHVGNKREDLLCKKSQVERTIELQIKVHEMSKKATACWLHDLSVMLHFDGAGRLCRSGCDVSITHVRVGLLCGWHRQHQHTQISVLFKSSCSECACMRTLCQCQPLLTSLAHRGHGLDQKTTKFQKNASETHASHPAAVLKPWRQRSTNDLDQW